MTQQCRCGKKTFVKMRAILNQIDFKLLPSPSLPVPLFPLPTRLPLPLRFLFAPSLPLPLLWFLLSHLHRSPLAAPRLRCRRRRRRRKAQWSWRSAASGSCWDELPMETSRMLSHPCWCETLYVASLCDSFFDRLVRFCWCTTRKGKTSDWVLALYELSEKCATRSMQGYVVVPN